LTLRLGKVSGWISLALVGALFFPFQAWAGAEAGKGSAGKPSTGVKKTTLKPAAKQKASSRSRKRGWRTSYRYRLSRLKLEPQRVQEIQQTLIQAGYLNQEPTGRWDDPTRNAMRRYQADHGFPTTGLPEAKSLMKLGLGPHPLPEELDPTVQARAGIRPSAQPEPTPAQRPSASPYLHENQ
jgi:peptidoglycan hydrolase-like protein with peptidoglycan-binding domain